jgi:mRNA-degrading endonuclease toxin of MazEF toxin-antitoxin module
LPTAGSLFLWTTKAGQFGLTKDCVVQCESVAPIPKDMIDVDAGPVATLTEDVLREVIKAIGYVIDSDCEPN